MSDEATQGSTAGSGSVPGSMRESMEGKVVLVTGAGTGIGRATAQRLAAEGARVVAGDLDASEGLATVAAIAEAGGEASFQACDVSDEAQVASLVGLARERYGGLDGAVNNAGVNGPMGPVDGLSLEDWRRTLDVNLTGVFLGLKYELPLLRERGSGAIVNVASGAGVIATPNLAAYCASKHGVLGLTKTAAVENAAAGIRVNAVCPGSTDTPMLRASMSISPEVEKMILRSLPGGRLGRPDEIAEAIRWLLSDAASFVSGESMLVDGGSVAR